MLRRAAVLAVVLATCAFATEAQTPPSLIVQRAGPDGELATLDQANEIRVVFSEPMVTLGRIPQPVTAPFVRIEPAIRGTFRWSGTTILIFTPDPRQPLPFATTYQVTVDTSARAVSGRQLDGSVQLPLHDARRPVARRRSPTPGRPRRSTGWCFCCVSISRCSRRPCSLTSARVCSRTTGISPP